ncbi:MAG: hypothetical protein L6R40_008821, partial [Gallowayella cf. fulva]
TPPFPHTSFLAQPSLLPRPFPLPSLPTLRQYPNAKPSSTSTALLPFAFPNNQSVTLTTLAILSKLPPSSACSIVCVTTLPSSSNSKMNKPQNSSDCLPKLVGLDNHSVNLLTCSRGPMPRYSALVLRADEGVSDSEREEEVFQRTMSRSFCCLGGGGSKEARSEYTEGPTLTTRSEMMISLTLPTMGIRPQARGADQSAAW